MVKITVMMFVVLGIVIIILLIRSYIIANFSPFKENKILDLKRKTPEEYGKELIRCQIKERKLEEPKRLKELERIKRINEKEKQQKISEETKNKVYKTHQTLRVEIMQMPIYERWKKDIFEKCGGKCQMCGKIDNLEVHHRYSFYKIIQNNNINTTEEAFECRQLWDIGNGEVLCRQCHIKMDSSKYYILNN
ncbi:MAG: HNH endonuclease signature motif containing protein [bacterium]|nr:HNH endonuclease signature motif containing protein [bacterium]